MLYQAQSKYISEERLSVRPVSNGEDEPIVKRGGPAIASVDPGKNVPEDIGRHAERVHDQDASSAPLVCLASQSAEEHRGTQVGFRGHPSSLA